MIGRRQVCHLPGTMRLRAELLVKSGFCFDRGQSILEAGCGEGVAERGREGLLIGDPNSATDDPAHQQNAAFAQT